MIENVSTQLTVFHCFAHCLLPGRAFASLYVLLFLEKEAEIGGRAGIQQVAKVACISRHQKFRLVNHIILTIIFVCIPFIISELNMHISSGYSALRFNAVRQFCQHTEHG